MVQHLSLKEHNFKVETNWASRVICYKMVNRRKEILLLPHGDLIMKILEQINFILEEEESIGNSIRIERHTLGKYT